MFRFSINEKRFAVGLILAAVVLLPLACSQMNEANLFQEIITPVSPDQSVSLLPSETITPVSGESVPAAAQSGSDEWYRLYFTTPTKNGKASPEIPQIMEGLISAINAAQKSLDIAIYELDLDQIGDAIRDAAQRGVKVRIVTDSDSLNADKTLTDLAKEKIEIVPDERNAIMHDKFMVVDGKFVWTGSWNFTFSDTYRNNNNAIYIQSEKLAKNYTAEFEEMFMERKFGPESPENTVYPELQIGNSLVDTCFAPEDHCGDKVIDLVKESQKSIHFMAFSFTNNAVGNAIAKRAKAGVKVSGVFEARNVSDEFSEYAYFKKQHMNVRLDGNKYYMHHKVIIIDDQIVIMGSFNFTDNADKSNDENILVIYNPNIAAQYLEEFRRVYEKAK
jgi:phosphatidylserine/phosphatidylglycerophosphate/cardiolipin synthase-like enzyme